MFNQKPIKELLEEKKILDGQIESANTQLNTILEYERVVNEVNSRKAELKKINKQIQPKKFSTVTNNIKVKIKKYSPAFKWVWEILKNIGKNANNYKLDLNRKGSAVNWIFALISIFILGVVYVTMSVPWQSVMDNIVPQINASYLPTINKIQTNWMYFPIYMFFGILAGAIFSMTRNNQDQVY